MAKAKNGHNRKREPKVAGPAAPVTSTEQLNDDQLLVLFFQHKRKVKELEATLRVAKDALAQGYKLAAAEGISKKELKLAIELETDEGKAKLEAERGRQERVARWMGEPLGTQRDLVGDVQFDAGKRAAMNDEPARPPSQLAQRDHQRWLEGHAAGVQIMNAQRASGFKKLGDQPVTAALQ